MFMGQCLSPYMGLLWALGDVRAWVSVGVGCGSESWSWVSVGVFGWSGGLCMGGV